MMANIFIDTEVFDSHGYDFEREDFKVLADLVNKGRVRVLISSIVDKEVIAHIREQSDDAQKAIRKSLKENSVLRHLPQVPFDTMTKKDALSDLTAIRLKQWDDWKSLNVVEIVTTEDVDSEKIFESYFEKLPPFGSGRKKSEFPDAFTLEAAREWCIHKKETLVFVSKDKDCRDFCENHPTSFEWVSTLAEALERLSDEAIVKLIHEGFESMNAELVNYLGMEFEASEFTSYEHEGDVSDVDVKSVAIEEIHIVSAEDGEGVAELKVIFHYTANVEFDDPDSGLWDGEEKKMWFVERKSVEVEEQITDIVTLDFTYDESDPTEVEIDKISLEDNSHDIDLGKYFYPEID